MRRPVVGASERVSSSLLLRRLVRVDGCEERLEVRILIGLEFALGFVPQLNLGAIGGVSLREGIRPHLPVREGVSEFCHLAGDGLHSRFHVAQALFRVHLLAGSKLYTRVVEQLVRLARG